MNYLPLATARAESIVTPKRTPSGYGGCDHATSPSSPEAHPEAASGSMPHTIITVLYMGVVGAGALSNGLVLLSLLVSYSRRRCSSSRSRAAVATASRSHSHLNAIDIDSTRTRTHFNPNLIANGNVIDIASGSGGRWGGARAQAQSRERRRVRQASKQSTYATQRYLLALCLVNVAALALVSPTHWLQLTHLFGPSPMLVCKLGSSLQCTLKQLFYGNFDSHCLNFLPYLEKPSIRVFLFVEIEIKLGSDSNRD